MENDRLKEIMDSHIRWLNCEDDGVRADLRGSSLRGSNLSWSDLSESDLREAKLPPFQICDGDLIGWTKMKMGKSG